MTPIPADSTAGAPPALPPHAQVIEMVSGHFMEKGIYALAELGVADHLKRESADGGSTGTCDTHRPSAPFQPSVAVRCARPRAIHRPYAGRPRDVPAVGELMHAVKAGKPLQSAMLGERFFEAVRYAADAHAGQVRKGTSVPYLGHLLGVASIVIDAGGDENEAIAALLHDVAEDAGGRERLAEVRARFGDTVARIVEACTDSWETPKKPWIERKRAYVEHAQQLKPDELRVSAADKVHNAYAILRDVRLHGDIVWDRFKAPAADVLWYYEALVRAYRQAGGGPLVEELARIVRGIEREVAY